MQPLGIFRSCSILSFPGAQNAYTHHVSERVFANAQTGKIVSMRQNPVIFHYANII